MKLIKVDPYNDKHVLFMYNMLDERDDSINISFEMPSLLEHQRFLLNHPYQAWYIILVDDRIIGNIYLNQDNSIGVFIQSQHQGRGYSTRAIKNLVRLHPRDSYLFNINPENYKGKRLIQKLKGNLIQHTYRVDDILDLE